jgi:murein L,D-transpeptidase YafK
MTARIVIRLIQGTLLSSIAATAVAGGSLERSGDLAQGRLPAYILEVPETVPEVLIADAQSSTLWRFDTRGGDIVPRDRRYMSIGVNGVGKQRAWDRKTPLGTYFVTEQLDTSKMHEKYGIAAFPLDYPNAWDRHNSRTGDGIWLHGVDRRDPQRPPRDTDGCLAVPNEELVALAETLELHVTPVIVARDLAWTDRENLRHRRIEFRSSLDGWRKSLQQGDLLTYLSFYHEDFRNRGMDKSEWSSYRMKVFEARNLSNVELENVLLIADPGEPDLYLSRFTQIFHTDAGRVSTTKRLYWRRESAGTWKIVSEDAG